MAATSLYGHVRPVVQIGRAMAARGHRVTVLTGVSYRTAVLAAGLDFRGLPDAADLSGPGRRLAPRSRAPRWVQGPDAILTSFVRPLKWQAEAVHRVLAEGSTAGAPYSLIIADVAFLGVQPLLLGCDPRPPVIGISATPVSISSIDTAPFGSALPPWPGRIGRMRNRQTEWLLRHGPLRRVNRDLGRALGEFGVPAGGMIFTDAALAFDHVFQLGLPELEYPRPDLPARIEFVGPLPAAPAARAVVDDGLAELPTDRPIVHVSQGTVDNRDPERLIIPAARGLATEDVRLVISTGGRPTEELRSRLRPWPDNAYVASFVDYARLLPRTTVMITNGGYGGVQLAARHGVGLIVAGDTEDKPEVAARAAWSGVGIDLHTGNPRPGRLRRAVRTVLADDRYRRRGAEIRAAADLRPDPAALIVARAEELAGGPGPADQPPTADTGDVGDARDPGRRRRYAEPTHERAGRSAGPMGGGG